jgi:putative tricarboxylic transport membrane protein
MLSIFASLFERMCHGVNNAGVWAGIVILVYAITIFYQSFSLDYSTRLGPGPGFFPRWLSGGLIALTLMYIWDSAKNTIISSSDLWPKGRALGTILSMLGGLVIFTTIVDYSGFVIAGSILLFAMFIRDYKWYTALGASVAIAVLLLFVFQSLLGVTLPVNEFGW